MSKAAVTGCAYCGDNAGPFQHEHVVQRCLWDDMRPNQMVTVPACGRCNQGYGEDEEYFRTVLVALAGEGCHPEVEKLLNGKVMRSLARSRRLRADLTRGFGRRPRFTPSGLCLGRDWSFQLDLVRFSRGVEKTVRGLFYYKSRRPFAPGVVVRVFPGNSFWQDQGFQTLLAQMSEWAGVGDDVFQCRGTRDAMDPDVTAWLFVYYQTVGVFAWTERGQATGPSAAGGGGG